MGTLIYNGRMTMTIEDRTLAHLQVVIINKLRRRETFTFTGSEDTRETVCWITPAIPLEFVYSGNRRPLLNREWLEQMAEAANANSGLFIMPEPAPTTRIDREPNPERAGKPKRRVKPMEPTAPTPPVPEPVTA